MRAARETGSTSSTRSSAPRSSDAAPSNVLGIRGSTPPTTLVPPPYGMTATFAPAAHSSAVSTSDLVGAGG